MSPVGFDNTILSILLNPNCRMPTDEAGVLLPLAKRRAEYLLDRLEKSRQKIIIPTPAAAELLTAIGPDAQQYFDIVARSRLFEVAAFDPKAALELAILNREVFGKLDAKNRAEPYQKVKIDRQIIAIFRVCGVEQLFTDDDGVARRAKLCGMNPITTRELPIPDSERQLRLELQPNEEIPQPAADPEILE